MLLAIKEYRLHSDYVEKNHIAWSLKEDKQDKIHSSAPTGPKIIGVHSKKREYVGLFLNMAGLGIIMFSSYLEIEW